MSITRVYIVLGLVGLSVLGLTLALAIPTSAAPPLRDAHQPQQIAALGSLLVPGAAYSTFVPLVYVPPGPCQLAPQLLSPAQGSQLASLAPVLSFMRGTWPVSSTTLSYARDPDFVLGRTNITVGGGNPGPLSLRATQNLEPATVYYWQVLDSCAFTSSPASPVYSFTTGSGGARPPAPMLISPISGTVTASHIVTFTWSAVAGATSYRLARCTGNCTSITTIVWSGTSYTDLFLSASATYSWSVQALNDYAYSDPSTFRLITTGPTLALRPTAPNASSARSEWVRAFITTRFFAWLTDAP